MRLQRLRAAFRRRPVRWLVATAVALEILLIPLFLLIGADGVLDAAIDRAGLTFNTDLVTATRLVALEPVAAVPVVLALLQVASPDIALLVVVGLGRGGSGLRAVGRRFRAWSPEVGARRGVRTWLVAVATFCAMSVTSGWLNAWTFDASAFDWSPPTTIGRISFGLVVAMFLDAGGLFEESAWRGFCLPHLQERHTPLVASMLVGGAWTLWHIPVKFDLVLAYGPGRAALLFGVLALKFTTLSVVMTYFVNRAGYATLLAIAMHGLSNDSLRLGGVVDPKTFAGELRSEINLVVPLLVVAAVLVVATAGRLAVDQVREPTLATVAR